MRCIHYGADNFNPVLFQPAINKATPWHKPAAGSGLWASPVDASFGWREWCIREEYMTDRLRRSFEFWLSSDARIYSIDCPDDAAALPMREDSFGSFISRSIFNFDFEAIRKRWDVIYLTYEGFQSTHFSQPGLYGWDCESVLVLNAGVIM